MLIRWKQLLLSIFKRLFQPFAPYDLPAVTSFYRPKPVIPVKTSHDFDWKKDHCVFWLSNIFVSINIWDEWRLHLNQFNLRFKEVFQNLNMVSEVKNAFPFAEEQIFDICCNYWRHWPLTNLRKEVLWEYTNLVFRATGQPINSRKGKNIPCFSARRYGRHLSLMCSRKRLHAE